MSTEAKEWASHHLPSKPRAKDILKQLGLYADEDGVTWAAVGTLAEEFQLSDRQVQRLLRTLEAEGYMVRTGKFRFRTVPYYQLALDWTGPLAEVRAARRAARRTPRPTGAQALEKPVAPARAKGDTDVTLQGAKGDISVASRVTPMSPDKKREKPSGADAPEACGRVLDPQFEAVLVAWINASPGRVSRKLAWPEWVEAASRCRPARLAAAALRYLAEDSDVQRLKAMSLHRWLAETRWEPWLADPVAPELPLGASGWAGPAEIRAHIVAARDEAYAGSWLDRCGWDAERKAVLTRTQLAADRLRGDFPRGLPGVDIIEKGGKG